MAKMPQKPARPVNAELLAALKNALSDLTRQERKDAKLRVTERLRGDGELRRPTELEMDREIDHRRSAVARELESALRDVVDVLREGDPIVARRREAAIQASVAAKTGQSAFKLMRLLKKYDPYLRNGQARGYLPSDRRYWSALGGAGGGNSGVDIRKAVTTLIEDCAMWQLKAVAIAKRPRGGDPITMRLILTRIVCLQLRIAGLNPTSTRRGLFERILAAVYGAVDVHVEDHVVHEDARRVLNEERFRKYRQGFP